MWFRSGKKEAPTESHRHVCDHCRLPINSEINMCWPCVEQVLGHKANWGTTGGGPTCSGPDHSLAESFDISAVVDGRYCESCARKYMPGPSNKELKEMRKGLEKILGDGT